MINYRSKYATTPSSFRLLRRSQVAKLYEGIERNVADARVYQHLKHITTSRLFFPQESYYSAVSGQRSAVSGQRSAVSGQRSEKLIITLESTENTSLLKIDICS